MLRPSASLASNYGYTAVMALVTLFLVPLYVRLLGDAWGQLAVCLTVQGLLFLADGTLSPLVLRDAARARRAGAWPGYRRFLRWYGAIAIVLFVLGQVALVALQPSIDAGLVPALRIALLQFAFQFANGAAIAFLIGHGHEREANLRLVGFALAKHGTALMLLLCVPTATTYLSAFAAVSVIEFFVNCLRLRGERRTSSYAEAATIDGWRGTALFVGASALGLATGQLDRVYLAFALPATRYGVYYLVGSVLLSLLSLQVPATRTYLPLIATAERPRAAAASMLKVVAVTIIAPALVTMLFARPLLMLWLHDAAIAAEGAPVLRLLMLALAMNALYAPAGALLVQARRYATIAAMNAAILVIQAVILYLLAPRVGIVAGALAWVACGAIQLAVAIVVWRRSDIAAHC